MCKSSVILLSKYLYLNNCPVFHIPTLFHNFSLTIQRKDPSDLKFPMEFNLSNDKLIHRINNYSFE